MRVLTLNQGSSSLKAGMYDVATDARRLASAQVDRIGLPQARLRVRRENDGVESEHVLEESSHGAALRATLQMFQRDTTIGIIDAVAHRVVHGGEFTEPQRLTPEVIAEVRRLVPVDPDHLPQTLEAFDTVERTWPGVPQIACFDTAFHRTIPRVARLVPLPAKFRDAGIRRYGFHGLSCESILYSLRTIDAAAAESRLIIAHLGNGASMTAVARGASVETTMGFSPAGGMTMGTRTGDLDPGVLLFAMRESRLSAADLNQLVNRDSGLLGVSGTTSDMRDLLVRETTDPCAADAVALFCYTARKFIGSLVAVLGALDALVFTGGIGEHAAPIRSRIVGGLSLFGIEIDDARNSAGDGVISTDSSRVIVRVMKTDEDLMLARHAREVMSVAQ